MTEKDPGRLADELEQQADELDRQNAELKGQIDETREDWQRKRGDASVPGAVPDDDKEGRSEGDEPKEKHGDDSDR